MVANNRALLFANGEARSPYRLSLLPDDYRIAVDGGLRHLRGLGLQPHLLVGDFDSISAAELESCREEGAEVLRYPSQKDQTDLELALDAALTRVTGNRDCFRVGRQVGPHFGQLGAALPA